MKKMFIIGGVAFLILAAAAGFIFIKKQNEETELMATETVSPDEFDAGTQLGSSPLIAAAKSQEEAERIADLYGIILIEYSEPGKIATFDTDKDPAEIIKMGQDNNYPQLELNHAGTYD